MVATLLAALIALFAAAFGSWSAVWLQTRRDEKKRKDAVKFQIYQLLTDLKHEYWRIASSEMQDKRATISNTERGHDRAWRILDLLREVDDWNRMEQLQRVTFGHPEWSAKERHASIGELLAELEEEMNPNFRHWSKTISAENFEKLGDHADHTVPGLLDQYRNPRTPGE